MATTVIKSGTSDFQADVTSNNEVKIAFGSTAVPLATNAAQESGGHLASIDSKLSNPMPVTGTFFQAVQPVSQSGTWSVTVTQATGTNLHTVVDSGSISVNNFPATQPVSGTVAVSNFPATQPVSGTITANQGTAGVSAWKVDGSATTQPVSGTVSVNNFPATQAVSGTVTANAGTNLNTSALALDSTVAKDSSLSTLNTSVNTLLKPASTLNAVTTLGSITNALPAGTNLLGKVGIDQTTPGTTNGVVVNSSALPTGAATSAKQDTVISNLQALNSLVPSTYDYISLSYTGSDLTGVVFKSGGSGGSTVSTLTLAYTSSILQSVTRT
jgi:hypothetical protein